MAAYPENAPIAAKDLSEAMTRSKEYTDGKIKDKVTAEELELAVGRAKEYTNDKADDIITNEIADLKAYIGYTDSDIYGLEADFENNKFTRLAGAVGKTPGADFDNIRAFGGRRRCALTNDGIVTAYYGDDNWPEPDGWNETLLHKKCAW